MLLWGSGRTREEKEWREERKGSLEMRRREMKEDRSRQVGSVEGGRSSGLGIAKVSGGRPDGRSRGVEMLGGRICCEGLGLSFKNLLGGCNGYTW